MKRIKMDKGDASVCLRRVRGRLKARRPLTPTEAAMRDAINARGGADDPAGAAMGLAKVARFRMSPTLQATRAVLDRHGFGGGELDVVVLAGMVYHLRRQS